MGRSCSMHGKDDKCKSENLNERDHFADVGLDVKIILKCILKKQDTKTCPRFISLRKGTSGGLL